MVLHLPYRNVYLLHQIAINKNYILHKTINVPPRAAVQQIKIVSESHNKLIVLLCHKQDAIKPTNDYRIETSRYLPY